MDLTWYRWDVRGDSGLVLRRGGETLITVSGLLRLGTYVRIRGEGILAFSTFNWRQKIVPGFSRTVLDQETLEKLWEIVYRSPGVFDLILGEEAVRAETDQEEYRFHRENVCIGEISGSIEKKRVEDREYSELRPCYRMELRDRAGELDRKLFTAVATFPALRFAA